MRFLKAGILVLVCAFAAHGQRLFQAQNVSGGGGGLTLSNVSPGAQTPNCTSGTTSCTVTLTVANGDFAYGFVMCRDTAAAESPGLVTDSASNVWTHGLIGGQQSGSYYNNTDYVVAAGSITTITGHCGATSTSTSLVVLVYHRTTGAWTFGAATTNAFGTGTTATSPTVTPTTSVPAIVSGYFVNVNASPAFTTANTTIRASQLDSTGNLLMSVGDQIISNVVGTSAASANTASSISWQAFGLWVK